MLNGKRVIVILQARLSSSRLPNKVILPVGRNFIPIISIITKSLKELNFVDSVYVAIPDNNESELLAKNISSKCIIHKGDLNNVFSRFYDICKKEEDSIIVRMTADNPIIIENLLNEIIQEHINGTYTYSNTIGLPLGCNFEIFNSRDLLNIDDKKLSDPEKEHVTLYFKNNKNLFKLNTKDYNSSIKDYRLTVDEFDDYCLIQTISSKINLGNVQYQDLEKVLLNNSSIKFLNSTVQQKTI